jgi:hypothetical protein
MRTITIISIICAFFIIIELVFASRIVDDFSFSRGLLLGIAINLCCIVPALAHWWSTEK